jgi:hypothetical protein
MDADADAADVGDAGDGALDGSDAEASDADASDAENADAAEDAADTHPLPTYDAGPPPAIDPYATDVTIAFGSFAARRVTRLRADLPSKYLDEDLELEADPSQLAVARVIQVQASKNGPTCGNAATSQDQQQQGCTVGERADGDGPSPTTIALATFGAATIVARRLRKRR